MHSKIHHNNAICYISINKLFMNLILDARLIVTQNYLFFRCNFLYKIVNVLVDRILKYNLKNIQKIIVSNKILETNLNQLIKYYFILDDSFKKYWAGLFNIKSSFVLEYSLIC